MDSPDSSIDNISPVGEEEVKEPSLSKKQLKRLKRQEIYQNVKKAKKEQKKEQKKAEKVAQKVEVGGSDETIEDKCKFALAVETDKKEVVPNVNRKMEKNDRFLNLCSLNFHIVIDCQWETEHVDSALRSLTQQIMFCYGFNRSSEKPAFMHLCNLGERTIRNLSKVKFENWVGVSSTQDDYLKNELFSIGKESGKKQLVYLTSDAEETLETLSPDEAYIIGGIVDRNRLKGITYQKALAQGIRTAKLPIKENFALSATHILTVNHVFEIMLRYAASGNWGDVLRQVLPKRKDAKERSAVPTDEVVEEEVTVEEVENPIEQEKTNNVDA